MHIRAKSKPWGRRNACRAQRQDCIKAQILRRLQTFSAALKVPKSIVASIILKWRKFGTTRTLPRAGCLSKLSNRGRRAMSSRDPVWRWEKLPKGQPSLQHSTDLGFMAEWPNRSLSSVKDMKSCLEYKKAPKGLSDSEKQDYLVWWNQDWTVWPQL